MSCHMTYYSFILIRGKLDLTLLHHLSDCKIVKPTNWLVEEKDRQATHKWNLADKWPHDDSNSTVQLEETNQSLIMMTTLKTLILQTNIHAVDAVMISEYVTQQPQ